MKLNQATAMRALALVPVSGLLGSRRPSAVGGRIGSVVVDTVEGMRVTRARSDIAKKGREVVAPFFSNRDAAPAVPRPPACAGVIASLFHGSPSPVFRGRELFVAVAEARFGCPLFLETPATEGDALGEVPAAHGLDDAAVASANPSDFPSFGVLSAGSNKKPSEPLTHHVSYLHKTKVPQMVSNLQSVWRGA